MLELTFSALVGRVLISCDAAHTRDLQILRGRYASGRSISNQTFDLELDDLLVNLRELAEWPPADQDFRWQPELLRIAEGNAIDATVLENRLAGAGDLTAPSLVDLESSWMAGLTDFQQRDLSKLRELAHGANFSVPGAGKTRVALAVFSASRYARQVTRMLVVCPKAAFESWYIEAGLCFAPPLRIGIVDSATIPAADVILINYERLPDARSILAQWLRGQPTMLVLDEAHRMKLGPAGAWGRVCFALGHWAARRLILTGTPAPNGARDLENLLSFVWPGQGRLAVSRAIQGNDLRTASSHLRPLFARTTKNELDLPPVDRFVRRLTLPPLHRELYDALLGQFSSSPRGGEREMEALGRVLLYLLMAATTPALLAIGASRHEPLPYRVPPLQVPGDSTLARLMKDLPQYELSPKYQEVLSIVAANAANGRKTLVWSTFVRNLKSLEHLLSGFRPAIVHGGTEDRAEQLARFRGDPDCLVLLSNPATLGEGVSLHQVCHDAVYLDRDFAAGRFMQSLDRIHRLGLGKNEQTRITVLVAENTIDELVEDRLAAKLNFMGSILDDPAVLELGDLAEEPSESVGMDMSDIRALLGYLNNHVTR